jgi:hypothetical protein
MPEVLYYVLPPFICAGVMFFLFKLLEAAGVTSTLDLELEPRAEAVRHQTSQRPHA